MSEASFEVGRVKDAAKGQWRHLLTQLGVDEEFLVNRHRSCPMCGGSDRFRWDDRQGEGTWFCNRCGAGDGISLAVRVCGSGFSETVNRTAQLLGLREDHGDRRRLPAGDNQRALSAGRQLQKLARTCKPAGTLVREYLLSRGLSDLPPGLLQHEALPYWHDGERVGDYPAMVARIVGEDDSLQAMHRTYLCPQGELPGSRKKITAPVKTVRGAAIRLWPYSGGTLGLAEGIETAMACHQLARMKGRPMTMWACVSSNIMSEWEPPRGTSIERLVICADNDPGFAGQSAAYKLAQKLSHPKYENRIGSIVVHIPKNVGEDWLDVLLSRHVRSKAA